MKSSGFMNKSLLILSVLLIALFAGCIEGSPSGDVTSTITQREYVCSDGVIVDDPALCERQQQESITEQESVSEIVPECSSNSDCGTSAYIGDYYCRENKVVRDYSQKNCVEGACKTNIEIKVIDSCNADEICVSGDAVCQRKSKAANLRIDRVPITLANLYPIRITVTNAGETPFDPSFDVYVYKGTEEYFSGSALLDEVDTLQPGESDTDELLVLGCMFREDGAYTLKIDVIDEDYDVIGSAEKEFSVDYWAAFGGGYANENTAGGVSSQYDFVVCGNNKCETGESKSSCPSDCKGLREDLEALDYTVTYIERNEGRYEQSSMWNYVLTVIKEEGKIPEEGNINLLWGHDVSNVVNPLAHLYYPNAELSVIKLFSNCGGRYITCITTISGDSNYGGCSENFNLPTEYC